MEVSVREEVRDVLRQRRRVHLRMVEYGAPPESHAFHVYDAFGRVLSTSDRTFDVVVLPGEAERLRLVVGTAAYAQAQLETAEAAPFTDVLEQNYPNPFNPQTKIAYTLSERRPVDLSVYDVLRRRVRILVREDVEAGRHEVVWDGRDDAGGAAASSVYIYRIEAGPYRAARRMLLLR